MIAVADTFVARDALYSASNMFDDANGALEMRLMREARLPELLWTRSDRMVLTDPRTGHSFVPGETSTDRTIYNAVALFCIIVLSVFLGEHTLTAWIDILEAMT